MLVLLVGADSKCEVGLVCGVGVPLLQLEALGAVAELVAQHPRFALGTLLLVSAKRAGAAVSGFSPMVQ